MLSLLLFALSLSIDSYGIGFAYGLKGIKIPIISKIIMSVMTLLCTLISICIGKLLYACLPTACSTWFSAGMLLLLGVYMIAASGKCDTSNQEKQAAFQEETEKRYYFVLRWLGLSVTIIRTPVAGDIDHSKIIDRKEAICIGFALSLDALGAGIGFGVNSSAFLFILPLLTGIFQYLFLCLGTCSGKILTQITMPWEKLMSILPGAVMILLAMMRILN